MIPTDHSPERWAGPIPALRFLEPGSIVPIDASTTAELCQSLARLRDENGRLREALRLARSDMRAAVREIDRELEAMR